MFKLKEEQYYSGVYYSFTKRGGLIAFLSKPVASEPTEGWITEMLTIIDLGQATPEIICTTMRATSAATEEETQRKILKYINNAIHNAGKKNSFRVDFIPVHGDRQAVITQVNASLKLNKPSCLMSLVNQ
jgi:hypothetical protein